MTTVETWISPKYTMAKLGSGKIEDKIDVFEDKVIGWTFDHADVLASNTDARARHAGFAILMLCSAYFETLHSCIEGRSASGGEYKTFFVKGFLRVPALAAAIPTTLTQQEREDIVAAVYREVRCGLYHQLSVKSRVAITQNGAAVRLKLDPSTNAPLAIILNPWALLNKLKAHFRKFVADFRDAANQSLRDTFELYFDGTRTSSPKIHVAVFGAGAKSTL
jgi:hypothetical protein